MSETRCYVDLSSLGGNRESITSKLEAASNGNSYIAAVRERDGVWEIHSKVCITELAQMLGLSREDIQIY